MNQKENSMVLSRGRQKRNAMHGTGTPGLLVAALAVATCTSQVNAKGRDWHIDFGDDSAQAEGRLTFTFVLDEGETNELTKEIAFDVQEGWGPDYKAQKFQEQVDPTNELEADVESNDSRVWVEVDEDWDDNQTIDSVSLEDTGTGEGVEYWYDDALAGVPIVELILDISGEATGGQFTLGIGNTDPNAHATVVTTVGMSGEQIKTAMVDAFNLLDPPGWGNWNYVASLVEGKVVVGDVPCPIGAAFGTTDTGLSYIFTMRRTHDRPVPATSEWGLMVLTILLLTAGTVVLGRRRANAE